MPALALAALVGVSACGLQNGAGYDRNLSYRVVSYYREHAAEKNYLCLAPEIRGITRWRVIEDTPERLVVSVRYNWTDTVYGQSEVDHLDITMSRCNGFGERIFTFDKRQGMRVVDMSGPRRRSSL